jgi:hypothetical protein
VSGKQREKRREGEGEGVPKSILLITIVERAVGVIR